MPRSHIGDFCRTLLAICQLHSFESPLESMVQFKIGIAILSVARLLIGCTADPMPAEESEIERSAGYSQEIHEFRSKVFDNTRALRVLLPPGYRDPDNAGRDYQVLYVNDGIAVARENSIDLGSVAAQLVADDMLEPIIIVAIDNGASTDKTTDPLADRAREFLPYPDVGPLGDDEPLPPGGSIGDLYPDFVVDEVIPYIERRYRIRPGRANRTVGGYSYGGTAALNTALRRPGEFGHLMLESTPLWMGADGEFMRDIRAASSWPGRIYIASGTSEVDDPATNEAAGILTAELIAAIHSASPSSCVMFFRDEGASHDQRDWHDRAPTALRSLYGSAGVCMDSNSISPATE